MNISRNCLNEACINCLTSRRTTRKVLRPKELQRGTLWKFMSLSKKIIDYFDLCLL